ncbi:MAG: LD-carboxypeptidase [Deltaproteobacteria bacterium]|nr:LD-carboxypeptidase [Deltaproteobacteria bacterium]
MLKLLKEGSTLAVAAPSGPFKKGIFLRGVSLLKKAGFKIKYGQGIFSRKDYLAGSDHRRAEELDNFLSDPQIEALLFARGGYGCQRLLPLLKKKVSPKIVMGSSDLTVLLLYLWKKYKIPSLYGPMVVSHLSKKENVSRFKKTVTYSDFLTRQNLSALSTIRPGKAQGRLTGGCLSLIISTLGTPWEIDTKDSILFLEDTNEPPYVVDRMLTQLEQAGKLKGVKGIVLGTFRLKSNYFPSAIKAVVQEKLSHFKGPVLWGIKFGHYPEPLILPLGGDGKIVGRQLIITKGVF